MTASNPPSTDFSGVSPLSHQNIYYSYKNGSTCSEKRYLVNGSWESFECSTRADTYRTFQYVDKAGNSSGVLTVYFNY